MIGVAPTYLGEKWKDSIVNFRQYFNLKVGMFGQVGGPVWEGNQQYALCLIIYIGTYK